MIKFSNKFILFTSIFGLFCNIAFANDPGVTDTEVIIGTHTQLTGPTSQGAIQAPVMKAYFDMINEQGGVNGRKIKYIYEDSACSSSQALQVTKKLVERDHVFAMFSGQGPPEMGVYNYLREKKVPDLWLASFYDIYANPVNHWTFQFQPGWIEEARVYGEYLKKHFPGKKVGTIFPDDKDGKEALKALTKAVDGKLEVISEEWKYGAANGNSQLLNLKNKGVDIIYLSNFVPPVAATIKYAKEINFKPQWMLMWLGCNTKLISLLGKDAEGIISWYYTYLEEDKDIPAVVKNFEFVKERLPKEVYVSQAISAQAMAEAMVETLKRAGRNLTRESVIKAAESFKDWQCSVCPTANSTSATKHVFSTGVKLRIIKDGKWGWINE